MKPPEGEVRKYPLNRRQHQKNTLYVLLCTVARFDLSRCDYFVLWILINDQAPCKTDGKRGSLLGDID